MKLRALLLAAAFAAPASPDSSHRQRGIVERSWKKGDFVVGTNDRIVAMQDEGDVLAIQIAQRGESCLLRRKRYPLRFPTQVTFKVRWTEAKFESPYPSVNLVFDPPDLDDPWWQAPIGGGNTPHAWSGGLSGFVFEFAENDDWKRVGVATHVEAAPGRHDYAPAKGQWVLLRVVLQKDRIQVFADGKRVSETPEDLSRLSHFALGFGDQTCTRVELDEFRVR